MEKPLEFTHLHVHTEYSLLDGSAKIQELVARAAALGMDSLAITDHGAMYGVVEFYKAAKAVGIKPILGCEVYVAPKSRLIKDNSQGFSYYHLVLLAETNEGYANLMKIVSYGFLEGFYYKPRVDEEILRRYHRGIIASSACLAGPVARTILMGDEKKAQEIALQYEDIFGKGNFFLELQDHGMPEQKRVNAALMRIHEQTGIPLIATNDSHYIYPEDAESHDILLCIQTGKTIHDEDRMRYEGGQFYLKSKEEMYALFPYATEALKNTQKIADRCHVELKFHELKLPRFDVPEGKTASEYLRELCYAGFAQKYPANDTQLRQRLEYELKTIETMGYVDYFLIVWDFIRFAKDHQIMVGPGRGSAAGSMVSYCLSITTIDPIKYDLIFERFLNPERVSMPDIDVDFCYERRQEVIDYVVEKYGEDHVAQIITFGTMAARGAVKDVGRALDRPYAEVDQISKMIPMELGITIEKALKMNPDLKKRYDQEEDVRYLLDMSMRLEGLPRHASTHAAGVVICRDPVMEYVPLNNNDGVIATQYTMTILEELGLLKMDFLGLRTLTVIQNAVKEVKRCQKVDIDIDHIPLDDQEVYQMIGQGKTEGVFQLESTGMKSFMKELQPTRIDDLIAGISLYRPGPMDFIPKYLRGKQDPDHIQYTHPFLEPILKSTYGCIVYQEQVMEIVRKLAGYSLGRSDLVRRAMSKKKEDVMAKERQNFVYGIEGQVPGCVANGIDAATAEKIFDEMTDFAKYAFNKSHAACYAVVGYETAYLKCHYPVEFMAALMTSVMDNTTKVAGYIEECKKMGIGLLPPDINEGYEGFSVSGGKIRFGLAAIKSVGRGTIRAMVEEREKNGPFRSLTGFFQRMDGKELNKRAVESFIKAGAFDSLGGERSQYMAGYKAIMDGLSSSRRNNLAGQMDLFAFVADTQEAPSLTDSLPQVPPYAMKEKLAMEKEVLGIYVSGHPLAEYMDQLDKKVNCHSRDLLADWEEETIQDGQRVIYGGILTEKTMKYTRNNKVMCFLKVEDLFGTVEVVVFPNVYEKYSDLLQEDAILLVKGRVQISPEEDGKIISDEIDLLTGAESTEQAPSPRALPQDAQLLHEPMGKKPKALFLRVPSQKELTMLEPLLQTYSGDIPVKVRNAETGDLLMTKQENWVNGSQALLSALIAQLGKDNVVLR